MFSKIKNVTIVKNEPLSKHCSFQIGGNARYFISAKSANALINVLEICNAHCIKHKIIGNGSNLLFDDLGYNGVIIKYENSFIKQKSNSIVCGAGISISKLLQFTTQNNLGGLEFAVGVPAQLGGAIVNNLGAYNQQISNNITQLTALQGKKIVNISTDECGFAYHSSKLQNGNFIVLSANFNLPYQSPEITKTKILEYISKRKSYQPLDLPNAGSVFKRKDNIVPAQLIDNAGLKGLQVGNAQISTKHAGFIVNLGTATCKDVLSLIKVIQNIIFEKYNVVLEPEIEYLPF